MHELENWLWDAACVICGPVERFTCSNLFQDRSYPELEAGYIFVHSPFAVSDRDCLRRKSVVIKK